LSFAREGAPIVLGLGAATMLVDVVAGRWVGLPVFVLTLFAAWFFRDPEREVPEGEDLVISPADGRVVAVDVERSPEGLPGERFQRVSIFMSPLDVHVNRVPVSGEVVAVRHTPGRFVAAYDERASRENERNEVVLRDSRGRPLVFVQIAGMLARRIICRLTPGQRVEQGSRYGLIMFGSRVDVYVPPTAEVRVRIGDRVEAGSSVLGVMR
jgi:phosphatidylserine decarboxylase